MNKARNVGSSEEKPKSAFKDGGKTFNSKTWRKTREMRVLAERNPAVVAVGAWVDSEIDVQEHPSVRATLTEALQAETRREKEQNLRQFQSTVRKRVSEHTRVRKQHQMQKYYQKALQECRVVQQSSDSAKRLTPQKDLFSSLPQGELAVCSPNACWVTAQEHKLSNTDDDDDDDDDGDQYCDQLKKVIKQVRHRLAACQTIQDSEVLTELPGGLWKRSPSRDKPALDVGKVIEDEDQEEEEDKIPLAGQHEEPLCMQSHMGKTVTFHNDPVKGCVRLVREERPASLSPHLRCAHVLWPEDDQEEQKKQRQSEYLMYRRFFMDIEREQVKEHQRQRKHLQRIARIKAEKEQQRQDEERRMKQQEECRREMVEREHLISERIRLEEEELEEEKRRARAKKAKETTRYIEALRVQMKKQLEQEKVELPPLCGCGESFWDSHPDTCANNCFFYNNPKGYAQVLHSVLLNCELNEGFWSYALKIKDIP